MNPGQLNKRIQIQARNAAEDDFGHESGEWVTLYSAWAKFIPVNSSEYFAGGSERNVQRYHIKFRYRAGFKSSFRIVCGSRVFEVVGFDNENDKNRYLICECEEVVDG